MKFTKCFFSSASERFMIYSGATVLVSQYL